MFVAKLERAKHWSEQKKIGEFQCFDKQEQLVSIKH